MELDTKQKVLIAIYTEYQKDKPNMKSITNEVLGIDRDAFYVALDKLDNEGLVNGIKFLRGGNCAIPSAVVINCAQMSPRGIDYIESKLGIERTATSQEKAETVHKTFAEQGMSVLTDFAAKVVAEIVKSQVGQ